MSKSDKSGKTKTKSSFLESGPTVFVMGYVDLIFTIKLTESDLQNEDKQIKFEDLSSIKDLDFLKDKTDIWDRIILRGGNDTLRHLLIGNKTSKKKCRIDYIGYGILKFEGDEEFFDDIFNFVTSKYHLAISKKPLNEGSRSSLTIVLKYKDQVQTINVGKSQEEEDKENKKKKSKNKAKNDKIEKKEKKDNKKDKEEEEEEEDEDSDDEGEGDGEDGDDDEEKKEDDYEETDAMKEKKIPKFKRGSSVLVNLNPTFSKHELVYINYVDIKKIPGDFKMKDLFELIRFLKNKGSTLFVNFFKPKKPKITNEPEEPDDSHEKDNNIVAEGKTKESQDEKEKDEPEEKKEEKKKEKEGPSKKMLELNQLYEYTNIFFFDCRQCQKIFNKHYNTFTEDNINNRKKINNKSKVFDYFIKGIATATKEEVTGMKTGLFMDKLNKFTIIFASNKSANKQEFDSQPHPKVNHSNLDLVNKYRKIIKENKDDYYSTLIASLVVNCTLYSPNCQSTEVLYPAFLIGLEIVKKKLECEKNNLPQDSKIYKVKLSEKILLKNLEQFASGGKEEGFVLDCLNKEKSSLKDYVSLYDYHLKNYFASEKIRKDLKSKGFINAKGFIMYDHIHRHFMGIKTEKKQKKISEEEMKYKLMNSINGIDVPGNIKDKEIDAKKHAKTQNIPTESKLPVSKDAMQNKKKKRRHKRRNKGENSSGGGSSEEYSSGNNSGLESGNDDPSMD